ncbi:uncharacterized protein KNAG_0A01510 [Huiozyma naganishii CBS 8797]|uniref:Uncharacterized protein n=1 Tax=Huiozyma naganishii (strain ATCC MYA-139 / BCRC 22969 / CBS 8797 / KCTC 17520 / NBRC 10181 / NCYC 3082 / Yp74L-3) TaxID=1071383 RepID=J7QZE7_HUIN7|nr:hypothetical protein KNAG_0A01510 [Kazachstania naganishii CBS 8797]CCK67840.1 hypothetical protein KNAG_0A01510 [Kazachstania naganishii CBS 8797]
MSQSASEKRPGKVWYNRHISFDDLAPSLIDDEIKLIKENNRHVGFNNKYIHVPPQYNPLYNGGGGGSGGGDGTKPRRSSGSAGESVGTGRNASARNYLLANTQLMTAAGRSRSASPFARRGKPVNVRAPTPRLPPPRGPPVIKKTGRAIDEQDAIADVDISNMDDDLERRINHDTKENTQSNSGSKYGYTQSLFSNLNEVEDRAENKKRGELVSGVATAQVTPDKSRRKSFANMTNEELAALEDYYTSKGRSSATKMENFDFSEQNTILYDSPTQNSSAMALELSDKLAPTYPSSPSVTHRAISLTIQNYKFTEYVTGIQKRIPIKDQKERRSSLRVVNCYISGRRYTWSSVDWYVENLAKDGDHLIIMTSIPNFEDKIDSIVYKEKRQKKKADNYKKMMGETTANNIISTKPDEQRVLSKGIRLQAIHEESKTAAKSILEYYAARLEDKIVKVTVELVKEDSTKNAITQVAALYKPHLQVISTVSTNVQIKFRNGNVKLPFFITKHYPMPEFIVPFEFIDPRKLVKDDMAVFQPVNKDNRLEWLDTVIKDTLENPFIKQHHYEQRAMESDDESPNGSRESVASVNEYFPISPETQKKIQLFEEIGYVIPKTSRDILMEDLNFMFDKDGKRLTPTSTSRRLSRVQIGAENSIYKVKSMIDDSASLDSNLRKTKSVTVGHQSHKFHNSLSATTSNRTKISSAPLSKAKSLDVATHHSSSRGSGRRLPLSPTSSKSRVKTTTKKSAEKKSKDKPKKKKTGLGSMFNKLFK